jgi:hypothetical protein
MSDTLKDMNKMGIKILQDTKTSKKEMTNAKSLPDKLNPKPEGSIHDMAIKKFIKDKPNKKHILEFFEKIIEIEETKL